MHGHSPISFRVAMIGAAFEKRTRKLERLDETALARRAGGPVGASNALTLSSSMRVVAGGACHGLGLGTGLVSRRSGGNGGVVGLCSDTSGSTACAAAGGVPVPLHLGWISLFGRRNSEPARAKPTRPESQAQRSVLCHATATRTHAPAQPSAHFFARALRALVRSVQR
jgi:hypothetical protein